MSLRSSSEENAKGHRRREDEIAHMIRQRLWGIHVEVNRLRKRRKSSWRDFIQLETWRHALGRDFFSSRTPSWPEENQEMCEKKSRLRTRERDSNFLKTKIARI